MSNSNLDEIPHDIEFMIGVLREMRVAVQGVKRIP
jgi:hypothetical protein